MPLKSATSIGMESCSRVTEPTHLLDSNICIYILEGRGSGLRERIESCPSGSIVTSSIAYAEVMLGVDRNDEDKMARAARFFDMFEVQAFNRIAADRYTAIPFKRARFDRLIAAHAQALDLVLVTNNEADFADVPGLKVENWTL